MREAHAAALATMLWMVLSPQMHAQTVWPPVVGRWDITVESPGSGYPSWLEVRASGTRTLDGTFVGRVGSAQPISGPIMIHGDHGLVESRNIILTPAR